MVYYAGSHQVSSGILLLSNLIITRICIFLFIHFSYPGGSTAMYRQRESVHPVYFFNIILILMFLLFAVISPTLAEESTGEKSKEAPPFRLSTADGKQVSLPDLKADGPTILVFWAFWCDTWKTVTEGYEQLSAEMKNVPFKYYVIAIDPAMPEVVQLEKKDGNLPFPVLVDKDGSVSRLYKIKAVPTFFVLDRQGKIILRHEGYPGNAVLKKLIWELNTQPPSP